MDSYSEVIFIRVTQLIMCKKMKAHFFWLDQNLILKSINQYLKILFHMNMQVQFKYMIWVTL